MSAQTHPFDRLDDQALERRIVDLTIKRREASTADEWNAAASECEAAQRELDRRREVVAARAPGVTFTPEQAAMLRRHMQSSNLSSYLSDAEQAVSSECWRKLEVFGPPPRELVLPKPVRWQIQLEDHTVLVPISFTSLDEAKQVASVLPDTPGQRIVIRQVT